MVRELERESRIVSFRLTIPDRPGVLGVIATRLGQLGANILEVSITAACSSTCRRKAPSSTSRWRRATPRTREDIYACADRRRLRSRSGSRQAGRWSEAY